MREALIQFGIPRDEWWLESIDECVENALRGVPDALGNALLMVSNQWRPRVFHMFYLLLFREGKVDKSTFRAAAFALYQQESERLFVYFKGPQKVADMLQELSEPQLITEPLTLWRGIAKRWDPGHKAIIKGISWTTDLEIACFFATDLRSSAPENERFVVRTVVQPPAVLGFLDSRNEKEVLVNPKRITSVFLEDFNRLGKRIDTKRMPKISSELFARWKEKSEKYSAKTLTPNDTPNDMLDVVR
jgi:hypothetical protein